MQQWNPSKLGLRHLQQRKHELDQKQTLYKTLLQNEQDAWSQYLEKRVRSEAEESTEWFAIQVRLQAYETMSRTTPLHNSKTS